MRNMRRDNRARNNNKDAMQNKIIIYCAIGVAVLTVILVALLMYSRHLNEEMQDNIIDFEDMANITSDNNTTNTTNTNTESVSTEIGKSVNEVQNEINTTNSTNTTNNTATNTYDLSKLTNGIYQIEFNYKKENSNIEKVTRIELLIDSNPLIKQENREGYIEVISASFSYKE